MNTMNHNIETSTAAIGHFVYHGLYETVLGEHMGCVPYDKRDAANDEIGVYYVDLLTDVFSNDVFCDMIDYCEDEFSLEYCRTYHPRYYNFETDSIMFAFGYTNELRDAMYNQVKNNEHFAKFLADNYTSRDGFISYTPNNWNDWNEGWLEDDWRCVSALLRFLLETNVTESEEEGYWYDFNEKEYEIITEQYSPSEYAVKFDNGIIAATILTYDDEIDQVVYHGYLIDNDSNIINTYDIIDEYDDFYGSAFAALEYSDMIIELTDGYKHGCGYHTTKCDIPEFLY